MRFQHLIVRPAALATIQAPRGGDQNLSELVLDQNEHAILAHLLALHNKAR